MEDVPAVVERLRVRCEQARVARIRAEQEREQAEAAVSQASSALHSEFGVSTADQARLLLEDLDRKIAMEVQEIEKSLGG